MMAGGGSPAPTNPYVTDGLVFWLDGIDKGGVEGYWTDLIGGYDFPIPSGVTSILDGMVFDNPHGQMYHTDWREHIDTPFADATVEVVCTYQQSQCFPWCSSASKGTCFCFYNGAVAINHDTSNQIYKVPDNVKDSAQHTYSATALDAYVDMAQMEVSPGTYFSGGTYGCVGSRWTGAWYYGTIKCIRVYSRQLTYAERLANAQADNQRFNLGLSI